MEYTEEFLNIEKHSCYSLQQLNESSLNNNQKEMDLEFPLEVNMDLVRNHRTDIDCGIGTPKPHLYKSEADQISLPSDFYMDQHDYEFSKDISPLPFKSVYQEKADSLKVPRV